ncbi:cation transporter [Flavobacteriaceae bacterium]|nr:cation transporter [Flavobacteriaceae bacterium]MDB9874153.1 cation transporter [Flavobacteriaceae bacterium]
MKHFKIILASAFLSVFFLACKNEPKTEIKTVETSVETTKNLDPNATYSKAEFSIKGMTCEIGCAKTIQKKLASMEGVKSATVDFKNEMAMVEYDVAKANPMSITKTVTSIADTYSVENMKTVADFSAAKKACAKDCKKADCKDKMKAHKKSCDKDCKKADCKDKMKADKKACAKDCKKECCAKKA